LTAANPLPRAIPPPLEVIYAEQAAFAWRTVRYLGVRAADAEDVVHEVFIIVQRRLADYDPGYPMKRWIAGIARNVVLHYHRSTRRSADREARAQAPSSEDLTPLDRVALAEAAAVLEAFLEDLKPEQREIFVLGELEGFSSPEIAEIVGRNVNTVYSSLRSTRRLFEKAVARHEAVRRREGG